jgi:acyl carrier protein
MPWPAGLRLVDPVLLIVRITVPTCHLALAPASCRWIPGPGAARLASVPMEGKKMTRDEAFGTFQGCVAEVLDIDPDQVKPEARWAEDLDADSLAVVEITLALNDAFSIRLPDVDPSKLATVGQAFDIVADIVGV